MRLEGLRKGFQNDCLKCALVIEVVGVFLPVSEQRKWKKVWIRDPDLGSAEVILYPKDSGANSSRIVLCEIFTVSGRDFD